jgi:hypothetical protein
MDEPNYITSDEDELIFHYFGVQALQALWQCMHYKSKLQKQKIYFPIMYARGKASTGIKR